MKSRVTEYAEREIRRLVTRFAIERMAAGFSIECLAKHADAPGPSVIRRVENGDTVPELPTLIRMGEAAGLRLDWVPAYLRPLLALDEFEVRALVEYAKAGWGEPRFDNAFPPQQRRACIEALTKLHDWERVQSGGDKVDAD